MKKAILFVDDDPTLLRGIRRGLFQKSSEWNLFFAQNAGEALSILAQLPVDLIVTDMRMPHMDGSELLEVVQKQYPQIIRFVLSGHTDQEISLRSTGVAHQFIAKPCDTQQLIRIIQRSFEIRQLQHNSALVEVINSIQKLPSLPSLYFELVREMQSSQATAASVSKIIGKDITMTAKILQIVNSAFFGLPNKITNLKQAVTFLGLNTIKSLVLSQHVFSEFSDYRSEFISVETLWTHSIGVGALAREIGRSCGASAATLDDIQVSGVMHDIGKLILLRVPGYFSRFGQYRQAHLSTGIPDDIQIEQEILHTTHAELGAYLLGIWGLPDPIVQAVAYHHAPAQLGETSFSALTAVYAANVILSAYVRPPAKRQPPVFDQAYLTSLGLNQQTGIWLEIAQDFFERTLA